MLRVAFFGLLVCLTASTHASGLLSDHQFTEQDSLLVMNAGNQQIVSWRADSKRVPASVIKILTALMSIEKWGLDHCFNTLFYQRGTELWVKGLGDPMLISEELDLIAAQLSQKLSIDLSSLHVDASYFDQLSVPGRGDTHDPYNAPLSAVSVNFNTIALKREAGKLRSAEPQTPLTEVAKALEASTAIGSKSTRINLRNLNLAQQQFAQILSAKLGASLTTNINQRVPNDAKLIYQHCNSHRLREVLQGALEYSNNFIANQLFVLLSANLSPEKIDPPLNFSFAQRLTNHWLKQRFGWEQAKLFDGAGLSRDNQFSARELMQVLDAFAPYQHLLKQYTLEPVFGVPIHAFAKSGTLTGVHSFAGYLIIGEHQYRFVFLFDRTMPFRYRESLLQELAAELALEPDAVMARRIREGL